MDLEKVAFPADCDAVILGLADDDQRPRIVLNSTRPPTRRRFTLAHEIGHFRIPWHLGTIVCHTDFGESDEDDLLHRASEGEANTFAYELLLPQQWLRDPRRSDRRSARCSCVLPVVMCPHYGSTYPR
jgi:Zn-dependent peptidase ImmA (M78 family)